MSRTEINHCHLHSVEQLCEDVSLGHPEPRRSQPEWLERLLDLVSHKARTQ